MKLLVLALLVLAGSTCLAQSRGTGTERDPDYYLEAYAAHYRVPIRFARAIVTVESDWRPRAVSPKGAVGLMQLMPETAKQLEVTDRYDPHQNIRGGIRYLARLMQRFHNDLRLAAAAYYAGEPVIARCGLGCRNPDVVAYVSRVRTTYLRECAIEGRITHSAEKRDMR